jgi:single-stranded DNA-binding protein
MKVIVVGELQPEQVETPDGALVMSLGVHGSAVEFGDKKKDVMQFVPDLIETFTDIPREDLIDW